MIIFVSYQRIDTTFAALAVTYALRHAGHEVFFDTGSIEGGEPFREAIAGAVARSNLLLALVGPNFDVTRLHDPASVVAYEWQRARFHGTAVVPLLVDGAGMPADAALPPPLRWFGRRNAVPLRRATSGADLEALVAEVPALGTTPRRAARVLWVDDRPANNEWERKLLRPHGIVFDNVVSTEEALDQLARESYDLVITDLGREGSSDASATAGAAFLEQPVLRQGGPPVIVYAGTWAVLQREDLRRRGALDVMANREQLLQTVLQVLGRGAAPAADLVR
jgi:CheY-like chemotaxis protein